MTKSLPPKPSVKFLKLEAKSILKAHRNADSSCCVVLRNLHQFKDKPDKDMLESSIPLQEVQFALAMEYGFKSWNELTAEISRAVNISKTEGLDYSNVKLAGNGFVHDSFCLSLEAATRLLGQHISYEKLLAFTTNAFAPGFDIGNDCKELWVAEAWVEYLSSDGASWHRLGLSVEPLNLPERNKQHLGEIINEAIAADKVIVVTGGWKNNANIETVVEPWWAGILTEVKDDGTILGAHTNGKRDVIFENIVPGQVLTVTLREPIIDDKKAFIETLSRALKLIRAEDKFERGGYTAFGIDAMDEWIKQMQEVPYFCTPCQEHGGHGWRSATNVARAIMHRSDIAASFLRKHVERLPEEARLSVINVSKCYDHMTALLKPAVDSKDGESYKDFIGDIDKQKYHADTVLVTVKDELSKAADEMEKALAVMES